jgi:hypothetical protein
MRPTTMTPSHTVETLLRRNFSMGAFYDAYESIPAGEGGKGRNF